MGQTIGQVVTVSPGATVHRVRQRLSRALAWTIVLLAAAAPTLAVVIAIRSGNVGSIFNHHLFLPVSAAGFALIGGLVSARQPANSIGWIFLVTGAVQAVVTNAGYVVRGQVGSSALIDLAAWLGLWLWLWIPATFLPAYLVFLLFPYGRLPRGWWFAAWAGALGVVATSAALALLPGPLEVWDTPANPYGVSSFAPLLGLVLDIGTVLMGVGLVASVVALVVRYRKSSGLERRQLKWVVFAAVMLIVAFAISGLITVIFPEPRLATELGIVTTNLAILGIAVAAGIAILYHRLYDIDVSVNRTLVYAASTGCSTANATSPSRSWRNSESASSTPLNSTWCR